MALKFETDSHLVEDDPKAMLFLHVPSAERSIISVIGDEDERDELIEFIEAADDEATADS